MGKLLYVEDLEYWSDEREFASLAVYKFNERIQEWKNENYVNEIEFTLKNAGILVPINVELNSYLNKIIDGYLRVHLEYTLECPDVKLKLLKDESYPGLIKVAEENPAKKHNIAELKLESGYVLSIREGVFTFFKDREKTNPFKQSAIMTINRYVIDDNLCTWWLL